MKNLVMQYKLFLTGLLLLLTLPVQAKLQIFACEPEWAALSMELAGEQVEVFAATTAVQDPHYIQARPSLIARLRQADMLFCTGAGLEEGWLPVLLRRAANPSIQSGQPGYLMAADYVELRDRPVQVDRSQGDIHLEGDPHFITDPRTLLPVARGLAERLIQIDPAQRTVYENNLRRFEQGWRAAILDWEQQAQPLQGVQVVSQHKSWSYLLAWLGMQEVIRLEAKPGIPASSAHLQQVLEQVARRPVKMILRAGYQNGDPADWLQAQTQLPVVVLPYTVGGNAQASTLHALYADTVARLLAGLN